MDELMEMELDGPELEGKGKRVFAAGHACVCNPLKKKHYPADWYVPSLSPFSQATIALLHLPCGVIRSMKEDARNEFNQRYRIPENCAFTSQHDTPDIAQHTGPDPAVGPLGFMNGGLQVVNPCTAVYNQIVAHMESEASNMDFADQSLLSDLYKGRWVPLPYVYNALKTLKWVGVHHQIWKDEEVKNVHYILAPKPWDEMDEEGRNVGTDPTHQWWVDANNERLKLEVEKGLPKDGF